MNISLSLSITQEIPRGGVTDTSFVDEDAVGAGVDPGQLGHHQDTLIFDVCTVILYCECIRRRGGIV